MNQLYRSDGALGSQPIIAGGLRIRKVAPTPGLYANMFTENVLLNNIPGVKGVQDITQYPLRWAANHDDVLAERIDTFTEFMMGTNRVERVFRDDVAWKLKIKGSYRYESKGNLNGNDTKIGYKNKTIVLFFKEGTLVDGDTFAPLPQPGINVTIHNNGAPPERYGAGFRYYGKLAKGSVLPTLPAEYLEDGIEWFKVDSIYGEATSGRGSSHAFGQAWIEFGTGMTFYRKGFEVSGHAQNFSIHMQLTKDRAGTQLIDEVPDRIINYGELLALSQAKMEKGNRRLIGRSIGNEMEDSSSNLPRRAGPSWAEMMGYGHKRYYSATDNLIEVLESDVAAISQGGKIAVADRELVISAGEYFITKALKNLQTIVNKTSWTLEEQNFTKPAPNIFGGEQKGFAFPTRIPTRYLMTPGGSITFRHEPLFDSEYFMGTKKIPGTNYTLSSGMAVMQRFGSMNANGSIRILQHADYPIGGSWTFICGTVGPLGPIDNRTQTPGKFTSQHDRSMYSLTNEDRHGIVIEDVLGQVTWQLK